MDVTPIKATAEHRPRLVGLQYLRAIAALQVVVQHAAGAAGLTFSFPSFGVPLFFVISGFLMVAITDDRSRPAEFFKDRLIRIVPLYWIATTVIVLLLLLQGRLNPLHGLASYLFIPYGAPGAGHHFFPVLGVGWTLNYELMFYGLFALLLVFPRSALLPGLTVIFLALSVMGSYVPPAQAPVAFWCNPLILQFLAGAWVGHCWPSGRSLRALAILYILVLCTLTIVGGQLKNSVSLGILCALIVICALALEQAGGFRRPFRMLRFLGDASYSIYLWHTFVVVAATIGGRWTSVAGWPLLLITMAGSVAAGVASYVLLERPLLDALRRKRHPQAILVLAKP
jgi:exopolysaccharide production protein ExoZ